MATDEQETSAPGLDPWQFLKMLDDLASTDAGIGFIYGALDLLARRYELHDAVVVLADDRLGTQAFRLGRRQVDPTQLADLEGETGVVTYPAVVPDVVRDAVRSVCQLSLSLHQARHGAAHDPLTSIANRRAFDAALHNASVQSARYGWGFTLVLIDIDGLKRVNDTVGHAVGDDLLRTFGFALRRSVRSGDTAARIGGDEFAVILSNAESSEVASFLERLRATVLPSGVVIEFSVGAASAPRDSTEPGELFRIADARLYEKKGMLRR